MSACEACVNAMSVRRGKLPVFYCTVINRSMRYGVYECSRYEAAPKPTGDVWAFLAERLPGFDPGEYLVQVCGPDCERCHPASAEAAA